MSKINDHRRPLQDPELTGFGSGTDGRKATDAITSWTYSSGGKTLIDHSGGFASNGDLTATGIATFNGAAADLTTGGGQQAGNVFANGRVNIQDFSTTFSFQMRPPTTGPIGDGLTFIIQNDTGHKPGPDFGESTFRLSPTPGTMTVVDSFTPFDFKNRDIHDTDTSSTGVTLLPDFPGTAHPHPAVTADKSGTIRLLDQDNLGGVNPGGPDRVIQEFVADPHGPFYSSPVYFDGKIYIQGVNDVLKAYALKLDPATNTKMLDETPVSQGTTVSAFPGEVQSVSANGNSNGIVWSAQVDAFASSGPAILRAYDANDLSTPLYSSNQAGPREQPAVGSSLSRRPSPTGWSTSARNLRLTSTDSSRGRLARPTPSGPRPAPYRPRSGVSSPRARTIANPVRFPAAGRSPRSVRWLASPPHGPVRQRRESRGPPQLSSLRRTPSRAQAARANPS